MVPPLLRLHIPRSVMTNVGLLRRYETEGTMHQIGIGLLHSVSDEEGPDIQTRTMTDDRARLKSNRIVAVGLAQD